jgi:filamentous hemagglutinin family protein
MNGSLASYPRCKRISSAVLVSSFLLLIGLLNVSGAQITLDGSLGPAGAPTGPTYVITSNQGQIRGANLFHSFGKFNVPTDATVTFRGPNTIANIVARVTGGEPSIVNGTLRSAIAGANLFLLNPSGVMFGPHATLSVSGSFYVSTADFLRFADAATFFADLGQASALTVAAPAAFGFLAKNVAGIDITESMLRVPAGKVLSFAGGDVRIQHATLRAPSGRIQLVSVGAPRESLIIPTDATPDFQADSFSRLGWLRILGESNVDASGNNDARSRGAGGTVVIRSGQLIMDDAKVRSDTLAAANGVALAIDVGVADQAVLKDASELRVRPQGAGKGGALVVNAKTLSLSGGSRIFTTTSGTNAAGDLTVTASDAVSIEGADTEGLVSGLFANTSGMGDAGRVRIRTRTLDIDRGHIEALADKDSPGNAGSVGVRANSVTLTGGAQIKTTNEQRGDAATLKPSDASRVFTTGSGTETAGDLTITANDALSIVGADSADHVSGLFANTSGVKQAGRVVVKTGTLQLDQGHIEALADEHSLGNAGSVAVRAKNVIITGGAQINTSGEGKGNAGTLSVNASDAIAITGHKGAQSGLFSDTEASGNAGEVLVCARTVSMDGGRIEAVAQGNSSGRAGKVDVNVVGMKLTGGAEISTTTRGTGPGGQLTINATEHGAVLAFGYRLRRRREDDLRAARLARPLADASGSRSGPDAAHPRRYGWRGGGDLDAQRDAEPHASAVTGTHVGGFYSNRRHLIELSPDSKDLRSAWKSSCHVASRDPTSRGAAAR